jgi:CheY-like chemotaxis protein
VDDERPVREILAQALEDSGYRVQQAYHGRQALELIAQQPPDLVLSDVMMPLLGGVELCQTLKAAPAMPW